MITVEEANTLIFSATINSSIEVLPFDKSLERVLSEQVVADRPFPPFDRVMMDGIAIRFADWQSGQRIFKVEGMQCAGDPQMTMHEANSCLEVMTGAMLPNGVDAVIPFEWIEILNGVATMNDREVRQFQHIHKEGTDQQKGDVLLTTGTVISASEMATLASVGKREVAVKALPKVAIISTGDELVEVHETPEVYQIRKSNVWALEAGMKELGIAGVLFHLSDDKESILKTLQQIIADYDVVILSGGVSKGKKDFVPEVLEVLNVEKHFHRVAQRPGKPFWFGSHPTGAKVFALPGNPVSTFMCYYRYVRPWLKQQMQLPIIEETAVLTQDFEFEPSLTYFLQVSLDHHNGQLIATPIQGKGSGDLVNLNRADGFLELRQDQSQFLKGEAYPLIRFRL